MCTTLGLEILPKVSQIYKYLFFSLKLLKVLVVALSGSKTSSGVASPALNCKIFRIAGSLLGFISRALKDQTKDS